MVTRFLKKKILLWKWWWFFRLSENGDKDDNEKPH